MADAPSLIVLDILLGDDSLDGLELCKRLRDDGITIPVVFLTVLDRTSSPQYLLKALEIGGDDTR